MPAPRGPRPPDTPGLSASVGLRAARGPTHVDHGGGRAVPRRPKSSLGREVWWLVVQRDRDGAGEQGVQAQSPTTRSRPEASFPAPCAGDSESSS